MGSCCPDKKCLKAYSNELNLEEIQLDHDWENITCPICLDSPHNGVLLHCSSYDKGCRPFMCDTDHTHSNCLERFKSAYGIPIIVKVTSTLDGNAVEFIQDISSSPGRRPSCPLCRGDVIGWIIIDKARVHLNKKKRCCAEKKCSFVGDYGELLRHAQLKHPHSRPSQIDPAQRLAWENFQQSSDIVDVLSIIHSEVPRAVILGDYVIEYSDSETGAEFEDLRQNRNNWWKSCMSCELFPNFRVARNRQISRRIERRNARRASSNGRNLGEASSRSVNVREYRFVETDDELAHTSATSASSIVLTGHYLHTHT